PFDRQVRCAAAHDRSAHKAPRGQLSNITARFRFLPRAKPTRYFARCEVPDLLLSTSFIQLRLGLHPNGLDSLTDLRIQTFKAVRNSRTVFHEFVYLVKTPNIRSIIVAARPRAYVFQDSIDILSVVGDIRGHLGGHTNQARHRFVGYRLFIALKY